MLITNVSALSESLILKVRLRRWKNPDTDEIDEILRAASQAAVRNQATGRLSLRGYPARLFESAALRPCDKRFLAVASKSIA